MSRGPWFDAQVKHYFTRGLEETQTKLPSFNRPDEFESSAVRWNSFRLCLDSTLSLRTVGNDSQLPHSRIGSDSRKDLSKSTAMKLSIACLASAVSSIFLLHTQAASAAAETVVYSFCSHRNCADGSGPGDKLINVRGKLYGTTQLSGEFGYGNVFSFNPSTGVEKVRYSFDDNSLPAGLLDINDTLYGVSRVGGSYKDGTVFSLVRKSHSESVLHTFGSSGDGIAPQRGSLIDVDGVLYGTTSWGGAYNLGTVFSIDPKSRTETVIHSFQNNGTDGFNPEAGLVDLDGTLYGTTFAGGTQCGPQGCGTIYALNPRTGVETVLFSFTNYETGYGPLDRLFKYKGILYGTTYADGTAFSYNPETGVETTLHHFSGGADGLDPMAGLINVKGMLYSTTAYGGGTGCGGSGCGTVFSINPLSGAEGVVHAFQDNSSDGIEPQTDLVGVKGVLYGTTGYGGRNKAGTIFKITP